MRHDIFITSGTTIDASQTYRASVIQWTGAWLTHASMARALHSHLVKQQFAGFYEHTVNLGQCPRPFRLAITVHPRSTPPAVTPAQRKTRNRRARRRSHSAARECAC